MSMKTSVRGPRRFSSALSSAVYEWLLLLLLFVEASFSFFVTRFCRRYKLQIPCILCSRLDHVLGSEQPGFYRDLLCNAHKLEISSLALCHLHKKLADVSTMCEACLLSSATEEKSNSETFRLLVGKLGIGHSLSSVDGDGLQDDDVAKVHLLKEDMPSSPATRNCSCCCSPFRHKPHTLRLLQHKASGVNIGEVDNSMASVPGSSNLHEENALDKIRELPINSLSTQQTREKGFSCFSDVEYTQVKIVSDLETEIPIPGDDNENAPDTQADTIKELFATRCTESESITLVRDNSSASVKGNISPEEPVHSPPLVQELSQPISEVSEPTLDEQPQENKPHEILPFSSPGEGTEEIDYKPVEHKSNSLQVQVIAEGEQVSNTKDTPEFSELGCIATTSPVDVMMDWSSTEVSLKTSHTVSEPSSSFGNQMDLYDAYKLAVGTRESSVSPTFADLIVKRDSLKIHEDLKLLISQVSAARGVESPWHELSPSPRVYGEGEEPILQNISKRLSIERNESGFESLDGSIISEIEGESALERLKRQIDLDRKSISLLYKELEEERNASAIAANQAMAMITKLQEEKAAMQMEALQYQRMMEEQAEYDQEALRRCNEQLTEKEKQIQDLEVEAENFKNRFMGTSSSNKVPEQSGNHDKSLHLEGDYGSEVVETGTISKEFRETGLGGLKHPLLCFEDEKAYMSDCLSKLEKKLHLFSNNGVHVDVSSFDTDEDRVPKGAYVHHKGEDCVHSNGVLESNSGTNEQYSAEATITGRIEHPPEEDFSQGQRGGFMAETGPDGFVHENHRNKVFVDNGDDLMILDNELLHLRQRLEALELDRDFLEHAINSLKNGDDGVQFIKEIACELRELRRNGIMQQEHLPA